MAEYEPGMHKLLPQQEDVLESIIRRSNITNQNFNPETGCFPIQARRSINQESRTRTLYLSRLIGEDPQKKKILIRSGRIRITYTSGGKRGADIPASELRLVDELYSGTYEVGDSGWVLLNIKDPITGNHLLRDDLYEERLMKASQGLDPNIESDAPCILLHPDYRGLKNVQVIAFDPMIKSIQTGPIIPLDAVVLDADRRFIPKIVVRMLSQTTWSRHTLS